MSTATFRYTALRVLLDGVELVGQHAPISATTTIGYDQRTATASVRVAQLPVPLNPPTPLKTVVEIYMNAFTAVPGSNVRQPARDLRFKGLLVELDYTLDPPSVDLICRGPLVLAELGTYDGGVGIYGLDLAGATGATDENMVRSVLQYLGLCTEDYSGGPIGWPQFPVEMGDADATHPTGWSTPPSQSGTFLMLGQTNRTQFVWATGATAMSYIESLDAVSYDQTYTWGFRTFDTRTGKVVRRPTSVAAGTATGVVFTEGVDIFQGSGQQLALTATNRCTITGYNPGTAPKTYTLQQANAMLPGYMTETISSPLIEQSISTDGPGLACKDFATYRLTQTNRVLYKYSLTTPRDDNVNPGDTITINFNPNSTLRRLFAGTYYGAFYVQSITTTIDASAGFTQVLTVLGGPSTTAPLQIPPGMDFILHLEKELVVVAGAETVLYTAHCAPARTGGGGAISSYAWSTTGGGVPASGTGDTFTCAFTNLSGASITLIATDSNSLTGGATHKLPADSGINYLVRRLYLAGTNNIDDFGAALGWNVVGGQTQAVAVANAPLWGCFGTANASADDLATPPVGYTPFAGVVSGGTVVTVGSSGTAAAPIITTQPVAATAASGQVVTFTTVASGAPTPSVAWQLSTDAGVTWNAIAGATTATYACRAQQTDDGHQFRAVFTNSAGAVTSNAATLHVNTNVFVSDAATLASSTFGNQSSSYSVGLIPANWNTSGYDDTAWLAAGAVTTPTFIPGSSNVWDNSGGISPWAECLFRRHFTRPSGTLSSCVLQIAVGGSFAGVWINGHGSYGSQLSLSDYNPVHTYRIPLADLVSGNNVIAIWAKCQNGTDWIDCAVSFKISFS